MVVALGKSRRLLEPASAIWNDYLGTAAADDADAAFGALSLYELAGLDRGRWTIVSISLEHGPTSQRVTIYAFDRSRHDMNSYADLFQRKGARGELPVTAFHMEDKGQAEKFINEAFKTIVVRLRSRAFSAIAFEVDDEVQLSSWDM